MLTQILKVGALLATGRFLKPRLKGLLWILVVWVALWFIHSEYVSYVELSGDTAFVLQATLLKTALYGLSIAIYVLLVERKLWPKAVKMPPTPVITDSVHLADKPRLRADDDGFNFLREKPTLKNQAEDLLKK